MSAETFDHREWLESAALFALDALGGEERRAFATHAATCVECQGEVASLRAVGAALAYAVPQIDPPPALRTRVLTALTPGIMTRSSKNGAIKDRGSIRVSAFCGEHPEAAGF